MSGWTKAQFESVVKELMEKSKTDKSFRAQLLSDPHAAIQAATGHVIPANVKLNFVENNGASVTVVLPDLRSESDELSEAELAQVAGGSKQGATDFFTGMGDGFVAPFGVNVGSAPGSSEGTAGTIFGGVLGTGLLIAGS